MRPIRSTPIESGSTRPEPARLESQTLVAEIVTILRDIRRPLVRRLVQREDRLDRAGRHAGAAVDALVGMNIKHLGRFKRRFVLPRMNAVHRTDVHARGILGPDAWLANDIRHWTNSTSVLRSGAARSGRSGAGAARPAARSGTRVPGPGAGAGAA